MSKPFSESCVQNREPILAVISSILSESGKLLEIGSGTGQHAVYFAPELPHIDWYTSDQAMYLPGISMWLEEADLRNIHGPIELDVSLSTWPDIRADAVFSANTVHIMHWPDVVAMLSGAGRCLVEGGDLILYGPFNYDSRYTSESNARFDALLRSRDPQSGIRDFEALNELAERNGMSLENDFSMPANNRILHWKKNPT